MPKKSNRVAITNPAASRLPNQRGTFNSNVATPDVIRPKQITRHQQITPGPNVIVTSPASDLGNPDGP